MKFNGAFDLSQCYHGLLSLCNPFFGFFSVYIYCVGRLVEESAYFIVEDMLAYWFRFVVLLSRVTGFVDALSLA